MDIILDLNKLICSYLELEELLNLWDNNMTIGESIIKQYYFDIPDKGICKYYSTNTPEKCIFWKYPEYHDNTRSIDPKINYCHMIAPLSILWLEYPKVPCITNEFNLGHIKTVKYLKTKGFYIKRKYIDWEMIAKNAFNLNSLKMLYDDNVRSIGGFPSYFADYAIIRGCFDILEYLTNERGFNLYHNYMNLAIIHNQLDILKFVLTKWNRLKPTYQNMDDSIKHKNLEITKFLYQHYGLDIPQRALDIAINCKNYGIIDYLLEIGLGITKQTLRIAKKYPDILKILQQKKIR